LEDVRIHDIAPSSIRLYFCVVVAVARPASPARCLSVCVVLVHQPIEAAERGLVLIAGELVVDVGLAAVVLVFAIAGPALRPVQLRAGVPAGSAGAGSSWKRRQRRRATAFPFRVLYNRRLPA